MVEVRNGPASDAILAHDGAKRSEADVEPNATTFRIESGLRRVEDEDAFPCIFGAGQDGGHEQFASVDATIRHLSRPSRRGGGSPIGGASAVTARKAGAGATAAAPNPKKFRAIEWEGNQIRRYKIAQVDS